MKKAAMKIGNTESFVEEMNEDDDEESSVASGKIEEKDMSVDDNLTADIGDVEIVNPNEKHREKGAIPTNEAPIGQRRIAELDCNTKVTIADLGNACWTHNHFTAEIQTRQ